jgi:hypothetical protein
MRTLGYFLLAAILLVAPLTAMTVRAGSETPACCVNQAACCPGSSCCASGSHTPGAHCELR